MTLEEAVAKPKKNFWLTAGLSLVAAFLVWQRLSPSARPDVANAKQSGRVVVLFGDAEPALSEALGKELAVQVRHEATPGTTTAVAAGGIDYVLALKPNYLVVRLGLADLAAQTALQDTMKNLETVFTKAKASGALVAYVMEPVPPGVGDNWEMALRDLARQHGALVIQREKTQETAQAAARAIIAYF